ncbi:MAG: SDR family oxidoreductase [Devosia sp.]
MLLEGKTVIVTGASSGIGASAARLFAAEGANVVLGARRESRLQEHVKDIREVGGQAVHLAGDVTDEDYVAALVELAKTEFKRLDGAFNNAGTTGQLGPVTDTSMDEWRHVIDTNLTSAFLAAKYQLPALLESGGGSVVFTSSFVGYTVGLPGMASYGAAKAGVIGLAQVLAAEYGPDRIRVNALLPGGTKTEIAGNDPASHKYVAGLHAMKRMAEPDEIARVAAFLLSDHASFVTGSPVFADGGNSIAKS